MYSQELVWGPERNEDKDKEKVQKQGFKNLCAASIPYYADFNNHPNKVCASTCAKRCSLIWSNNGRKYPQW